MLKRVLPALLASVAACSAHDAAEVGTARARLSLPFSWSMAGALTLANEGFSVGAATLAADHFSYVGQYAMNGCQNNNPPYSCAANGCNYPGAPGSTEIPSSYQALADWLKSYQSQLYVGLWAVTYDAPEAEAHCMAEIANTLKASYGVTIDFFIVDAEKSYETHFDYTKRFVDVFDATIAFPLFKAEAPECHIAIDYPYWSSHGYAIQSQAYWNAYGLNPKYCLDFVAAYGVPKSQNQVMLDGYAMTPTATHSFSEYADDIAAFGGQGFSIWRTLNPPQAWDQWQALIETKGIAVYPTGGCQDLCAPSEKRCIDDDLYQDCGEFDADPCREWSPDYSCKASWPGTICVAGYCVGCAHDCAAGERRCVDDDQRQECGEHDGDPCRDWSPPQSCSAAAPGSSCVEGACVGGVDDAGLPDGSAVDATAAAEAGGGAGDAGAAGDGRPGEAGTGGVEAGGGGGGRVEGAGCACQTAAPDPSGAALLVALLLAGLWLARSAARSAAARAAGAQRAGEQR